MTRLSSIKAREIKAEEKGLHEMESKAKPFFEQSDEQRAAALKKATETRHERAEVRAALASGAKTLADVLAMADDRDSAVGGMRAGQTIRALPGVGKARSAAILEKARVDEKKTLRSLGSKQRESLIAATSAK